MKMALMMAFQNEAKFLDLHLPLLVDSGAFDGFVFLNGGSTDDSVEIIYKHCPNATIYRRAFDWNFSEHFNALIDCVEGKYLSEDDKSKPYDAVVRLDPDELMFKEDLLYIKNELIDGVPLMEFSRHNFVKNRLYHIPMLYPDKQVRAWHLHKGVRYGSQKVHETILGFPIYYPNINIFHYEGIRRNDNERWLKHMNYSLLSQGKAPLDKVPNDFVVPDDFDNRPYELFKNEQPLNPYLVGINAPFGASD